MAVGEGVQRVTKARAGILAHLLSVAERGCEYDEVGGSQMRQPVTIAPPWLRTIPDTMPWLRITHTLIGRNVMSKSNLEDGVADAIAATALISIGLTTLIIWLSSLPS